MASALNQPEIFKLLADRGADVTGSGAAFDIGHFSGVKSSNNTYLPLLRVLSSYLGDMIEDTPTEAVEGILPSIIGTPDEFLFLQRHICPSFYQMPHWVRFAVATRALDKTNVPDPSPETIRTILGDAPLSPQNLQREWPRTSHFHYYPPITLVHAIMVTIGRIATNTSRPPSYWNNWNIEATAILYESWRRLFREILEAGIDVHQIVAGQTPLLRFLGRLIFWGSIWPDSNSARWLDWDPALREWLADLKSAGIDLNQFGRREESIPKSGMVGREFGWPKYIRLIGFRYGPFPDDWSLWWSEWTDGFVGEFWAMIERRYEMPGSWPTNTNIIL